MDRWQRVGFLEDPLLSASRQSKQDRLMKFPVRFEVRYGADLHLFSDQSSTHPFPLML